MAVKNISTRAQICGRSANCHGGHSAVEQSSYISREKMYCEYDGQTYYPKYVEDLVHTEVMLPENAPAEYLDPKFLWNAVENAEKSSNAQLARTFRVELPNEWSYELATEVMRDYIKRNFTDKGMCVQFAIHDSENKEGQRNLHCHMLITLRGIDEEGKWMPKQKKVYLTDENGERIPLIDKMTGQQKVDKQNRKQWKCQTISTNDWSSKDNAKKWRIDLTETINSVNEKMGMTENFWEHRSFKDQGLDIVPQIHLGEKASAMERAGIHTIRGNINRSIIEKNAIIMQATAMIKEATKTIISAKAFASMGAKQIAGAIKNEILDMIHEVAKRKNERLSLPIIGTKYLRLISNRADMQSKEKMEQFVNNMGLTTFEGMKEFKQTEEQKYDAITSERAILYDRQEYLEGLLDLYKKYEPYIKNHKEQWSLSGRARKMYERKHMPELIYYDEYRKQLKAMIVEPDKKITPTAWKKELAEIEQKLGATKQPYSETVFRLASVEVLEHNKGDLERLLHNERSAREKQEKSVSKRKNISIE
ncbi:MobA/MobL family protein [Lacrimispora saccharolytica]|uniref:MobA/MobL family protein n=1 Tax=Lacrimispora saccharolytica TaxID=84030 RepID=UPI00265D1234|nr:MobA/MobL family protein [Lacrimispora saccharolytica]MCF2657334.1 MobA/MobL family protein [Lacrimispora saccharolytica]